jgi:hypothetical protein
MANVPSSKRSPKPSRASAARPPDNAGSADSADTPSPHEPASSPQLALASDGRLLLSTADLAQRDLTGRETFTAIFLTPTEARHILGRLDSAAAEAASRIAGKLPKR